MDSWRHWLKPDHVAFLLIGPCIILGGFHHFFHWLSFVFWGAALLLDLLEDEDATLI